MDPEEAFEGSSILPFSACGNEDPTIIRAGENVSLAIAQNLLQVKNKDISVYFGINEKTCLRTSLGTCSFNHQMNHYNASFNSIEK